MNLGRDFDTSSEGEARKLFQLALDVIEERFPDDTIGKIPIFEKHIELFEL